MVVSLPLNCGERVEILVGERLQRLVQHVERRADVDHHVLLGQLFAEECDIDDEGGAVHALGRPEKGIGKAVGDHDPVADLNGVHA